jgi:hypothetical protein
MSWRNVQSWLEQVDSPVNGPPLVDVDPIQLRWKRTLESPPPTMSTWSPKKRRLDPDDDWEATPRPIGARSMTSTSESSRGSPTKQLHSLRLGGIKTRTLDIDSDQLPSALRECLDYILSPVSTQRGIVHSSQRDAVRQHFSRSALQRAKWAHDSIFSDPSEGDPTTLKFVLKILRDAAECNDRSPRGVLEPDGILANPGQCDWIIPALV